MIISKNNIKKNFLMTICCVGIFLLFSLTISAKTLEKYKEDIQHLKRDFASMLSEDTDDDFRNKVFNEIPQLFPVQEKIEFNDTSIDVNNEWLAAEIKRYNEETEAEKKRLVLTSIYERLDAIEFKIEEVEASVERQASKDQEKQKLAEILKREEYQKPVEEEESLFQRFLNWIDEWLKNNVRPEREMPLPASNFGGVAYFLQVILYIVLAGIIGFLIYKFAPFFIRKFKGREKREKKERIILGEKIGENETSNNLFNEAEKLAVEGNLREAIRKGYIAFLFELSERKMIGLTKYKTNRDYLRSVRKQRELHNNMNGLTLNYERHWYGFQDAVEEDWEEFKTNYKEALSKN